MIQDIYPHLYHNEYHPRKPKIDDYILGYTKDTFLYHIDDTFFRYQEIHPDQEMIYLFEIDDTAFYLVDLSNYETKELPIRQLRTFQPQVLGFAAITGWQLYTWMNQNRYCGSCGIPTQLDLKERALRCPHCGNVIYPKLSPAVIVGVLNQNNQILLTKYAHSPYRNYALVAGYAEIGETIEETVKREVMEETGLQVTNIRYYKSQPWSFSSSLLFGFWCDVVGDDTIHLDQNELMLGTWVSSSDEITLPDTMSLTGEMIHLFMKGNIQYGS